MTVIRTNQHIGRDAAARYERHRGWRVIRDVRIVRWKQACAGLSGASRPALAAPTSHAHSSRFCTLSGLRDAPAGGNPARASLTSGESRPPQ